MAEMPPPPAREGDFRDLRAVMGVDDAVRRSEDRAMACRQMAAPAEQQHIAGPFLPGRDRHEVAQRGRGEHLRAQPLAPSGV